MQTAFIYDRSIRYVHLPAQAIAPNNGTTCPAVPFKITGVAPGQAPGTTAISREFSARVRDAI
jgi:hypothetical protein